MMGEGRYGRRAGAWLVALGLAALGFSLIETAKSETMTPLPIPAQAPAKEGVAQVPRRQLWYWDTGGTGAPIVLLHPATGSGSDLGLSAAGVREGRLSRHRLFAARLHQLGAVRARQSRHRLGGPARARGSPRAGRFHLVASAAGGSIASDFAFSYQPRLLSLTISSNSLGVRDGEIAKAAAFIRPKGWDDMPAEFRELGPSYRAANPEGVKAWMELEHKALIGRDFRQRAQERDHAGAAQGAQAAGAADRRRGRHVHAALDVAHDRGRDRRQPSRSSRKPGIPPIGSSRSCSTARCSTTSARWRSGGSQPARRFYATASGWAASSCSDRPARRPAKARG